MSIFFNPFGSAGRTAGSYVIAVLMIVFAGIGIYLVWKGKPVGMDVVFLFSFVPVGFYMLLTPSFFKIIGVANLVFLAAALLLHLDALMSRRARQKAV